MKNCTSFEDLSNDIFCEIFDHLNVLDLSLAFNSLNARISSILKYYHFHVVINSMYYQHQIEYLSQYLTFHSHQVISLDICDQICDQINIIEYLFERYEFPSLRYCTFRCLHPSSKLINVINQLKKQTQLVSFNILQSDGTENNQLTRNHAHLFSEMVLLNTPFSLRCTTLRFHYDYSELITSTIMTTNLIYLELLFYGSFNKISIYSLIPILRIHKSLQQLNVTIQSSKMSQHNINFNISNSLSINKDDLPIVSSLKIFNLQILVAHCNIHSLDLILSCMPNLRELSFTFIMERVLTPFNDVLLNGNIWQKLLTIHVPYLNKFNIHISFIRQELFDLKSIVDSFRCFVTQFDGWHMAASQWKTSREEYPRIVLRTLNYGHLIPGYKSIKSADICCSIFEMISTDSSNTNNHRYQSHINSAEFCMPRHTERQAIQSSPYVPFRNVDSLVIYRTKQLSTTSFLNSLFTLIYRYFWRNESCEYINHLSALIDLSTIVSLEFRGPNHSRQSNIVLSILKACVNVTKLKMYTSLLVLLTGINRPDLTLIFSGIKSLRLFDDDAYFQPRYRERIVQYCESWTKFVKCFPSLIKIEIRVFWHDYCVPLIDIFLTGFAKLHLIIVEFISGRLPSKPISRNHVIEKRRQSFGLDKNDEYKVNLTFGDDILRIWIP